MQQQFFPVTARTELLIELRMKAGSSFIATEEAVRRLERVLAADKDIVHSTAYIGQGSPRFFDSHSPELPDPGYAQFVLQTSGPEARERVRSRLLKLFNDEIAFSDLRGRVMRMEFGLSLIHI